MTKVREFWLTNANGIEYSLHNVKSFLHKPEGLGYAVDISTIRLGHSNMIISDEYNLGSVSGELLFILDRQEAYQEYFDFTKFLYNKPIKLHYMPPNTFDSYYCQVRIVDVVKTEYNVDGMLHVPIQMYRQTLWYTDKVNSITVKQEQEDGKHYELLRPYHYGMLSTGYIPVSNDGVAETPVLIEINGAVSDPVYSVYDSYNELYGRGKIIGTYDYVSIDSNDLNENISLMRNGAFITNAINYQDLTVGDPRKVNVTFLKLKPGKSVMTFGVGSEFDGEVTVSWRNAYVTV